MTYSALPQLIHLRPNLCRPRIISFLQALRSSHPPYNTSSQALKIGVAGFCWGGSFTVQLAWDEEKGRVARYFSHSSDKGSAAGSEKKALIDCAFTAHPALIKTPSDLEKVKVPLSVCIGVEDEWMKGSDVAVMKKVLNEKNGKENGGEGRHECVLLEGAKHGFAVRSWEGDKVQMGFADVAEKQALAWFERWLG
jgi:dienelactone hydrolase